MEVHIKSTKISLGIELPSMGPDQIGVRQLGPAVHRVAGLHSVVADCNVGPKAALCSSSTGVEVLAEGQWWPKETAEDPGLLLQPQFRC